MNFLQIVVNGGDNHIWITDSERFFFLINSIRHHSGMEQDF